LSADSGAPFRADARQIAHQAWPVFVGQIAVVANGTIDTLLIARYSSADLAAFAVGTASYVTVFIGLMGVVLALGPIVGRLYGARDLPAAGRQLHQAVWVALGLALLGAGALLFPTPFLALADVPAELQAKVRGYLAILAFSLPAALLFTAYRGFNIAVSRPKAVMAIQVSMLLAVKLPLSTLLVFGAPQVGLPALGITGCALATLCSTWAGCAVAWTVLRRDPFYAPFALRGRGLHRPERASIAAQLRLGVPMGASIVVEVTGMTFIAFFISRLSAHAVAGHQIVANAGALIFMIPLAIGNATSALAAQRIGAGLHEAAEKMAWHGIALAAAVAAVVGTSAMLARGPIIGLYTSDAAVAAAAMPLMALLAVFHFSDAMQAVTAAALRAWQVATAPLVINAVAIWGVGLGGGYLLAFDVLGGTPAGLQGAIGFWVAATVSLVFTAALLIALLLWVLRRKRLERTQA
jgi:multidrug resistance protein, MATE family